FQPGGITGVLLSNMLLPNLNLTGTIILLFGTLVVGLLASTRLSLGSALRQPAQEEAPPGSGPWERFRRWRERRKPVRTVVNIKPQSPPPLEITPRPIPIKPAPVAPPVPREEVPPPI